MKLTILYLSGNYGTIDTTALAYQEGILLDDAFLDVSDLEGAGVVLTRASYTADTAGRQQMPQSPMTIISPEELENVGYVTVDGLPFLKKTDCGFERCIVTTLEEILSEDESSDDIEEEPEIDDE
ncbi:MAG TPA: hypothetical protein K8V16_07640 [Rubneribacter badeniensis]|uniref:Uncharacterized protein n=1 Tax=Rubneribacter badeniensis TaxID=2070688 RepID=A0A9D2VKI3_9ACTN|nr:hypothetical protein [Rubneribacter badeniensis]